MQNEDDPVDLHVFVAFVFQNDLLRARAAACCDHFLVSTTTVCSFLSSEVERERGRNGKVDLLFFCS